MKVKRCSPMDRYLYLAPSAESLTKCSVEEMPTQGDGSVRIVCISDTHNEHEGLRLPAGDILLHTGDVLTESGLRHVKRDMAKKIISVSPEGENLFRGFASWFGKQHFDHKALVAGNHDLVLQGLGKDRVQEILSEACVFGEAVYLEHNEARVGRIRVFGSPYAHYGSHNNAFFHASPTYDVEPGVHIVATHMPAVLPSGQRKGELRYHEELTEPIFRSGALLHVSGHCHWASGLYHAKPSKGPKVPCVVASVCSSHWQMSATMQSASGIRGDPTDRRYGGYNLVQPGIVCDIFVPEERAPSLTCHVRVPGVAVSRARSAGPQERRRFRSSEQTSLLFFCPPGDEGALALLPELRKLFFVVHVETAADGVQAVSENSFGACVVKLGSRGNLGCDVLAMLRSSQGSGPFVAVHSSTAAGNEKLRLSMEAKYGVNVWVSHGQEAKLLEALSLVAEGGKSSDGVCILLFGPRNDAPFVDMIRPRLESLGKVDWVEEAADGVRAVREHNYAACVSKLGVEGNLGTDVIAAFRGEFGTSPFVAIHSSTAAARLDWIEELTSEFNVNLFVKHGEEDELIEAVARAVAKNDPRLEN